MHSVFVHLINVTKLEVATYLADHAQLGLREHWYFPNRQDPFFSIRFPHAGSEYRTPAEHDAVRQVIGREPQLTVQFDVGGKHPGHPELREFLVDLLGEFSGVALDDLSGHVWTLADLQADKHINNFAFADHESFRRSHIVPRAHHPHGTHER